MYLAVALFVVFVYAETAEEAGNGRVAGVSVNPSEVAREEDEVD